MYVCLYILKLITTLKCSLIYFLKILSLNCSSDIKHFKWFSGFRSSAEDLLSNRSMAFKDIEYSSHSANDKLISIDKDSVKYASEGSSKLQSEHSSVSDQQSTSVQSSKSLKGNVELTAVSPKNDQFHTIPSGSQNSVTIDFRQPLRLTLSNGESVQANQGINMQESQYLHTQVVTRVASEAAAAAATSAVIAVFETQKALLAEV